MKSEDLYGKITAEQSGHRRFIMEFTFLEFLKYDYPSILLVLGLIVLMLANRKNKLPAVFTLWIMTIIMVLSLFVEFV